MRENSKFIHDKFREMFPLLYEEVSFWSETKDKNTICLYCETTGGHRKCTYRFRYNDDSKWSLERA